MDIPVWGSRGINSLLGPAPSGHTENYIFGISLLALFSSPGGCCLKVTQWNERIKWTLCFSSYVYIIYIINVNLLANISASGVYSLVWMSGGGRGVRLRGLGGMRYSFQLLWQNILCDVILPGKTYTHKHTNKQPLHITTEAESESAIQRRVWGREILWNQYCFLQKLHWCALLNGFSVFIKNPLDKHNSY